MDDAVGVGTSGLDGEFEGVEGGTGIAAGDEGEVFQGLVGDGDLAGAVATLRVGEGAFEEVEGLLVVQGFEAKQPRPRQ